MLSRGKRARTAIEHALRALVLVALAVAAWIAARRPVEQDVERVGTPDLASALTRWTLAPPRRVDVTLEKTPVQSERDWLRALRRAGTPVAWRGDDIPALAVELAPVVSPRGGTMLWIAAPAGAQVAVADAIASIDTVVTTAGGAKLFTPVTADTVNASIGPHRASTSARDSLISRRVLVLGRATWEAKFLIAALEETGWLVDARLAIAPGVEVTQGVARAPDTARHAAVVVLDAPSATTGSAITRYVRLGGGAILSGTSANSASLADITVGRAGARIRASSMAFADDAPRRALAFLAITPRGDAIVLEERDGRVTAAARRADAGRVVQLGYDETWRWRLAGGPAALEAHRDWWVSLVSSVAYRASVPLPGDARDDAAPRARLVDALGPSSSPTADSPTRTRWSPSPALLFAVVSVLLLAEVTSRRLRGAP